MKRRVLLAYTLCLLVPALALGAGAWILLQREAAQVESRAIETARQASLLVAERMALAVAEAEDALAEQFVALGPGEREAALILLERRNPLIRNTFVWSAEDGLLWPPPEDRGTRERIRFWERYAGLLAGDVPWEGGPLPKVAPPSTSLEKQARSLPLKGLRAYAENAQWGEWTPPALSWMPWLHENQLYILGWAGDPAGRCGGSSWR